MREKIDFTMHVMQWEASGLSKAAYCKEQGLVYHTFLYHAGRILQHQSAGAFIPVSIEHDIAQSGKGKIEYHFATGGYFVFPADCPVQKIKLLTG